jgi:hypothetical protein
MSYPPAVGFGAGSVVVVVVVVVAGGTVVVGAGIVVVVTGMVVVLVGAGTVVVVAGAVVVVADVVVVVRGGLAHAGATVTRPTARVKPATRVGNTRIGAARRLSFMSGLPPAGRRLRPVVRRV